jgi:hypothetical protein
MRLRLLVSAGIGLASTLLCWYLMRHFRQGAADFDWSLRAAQDLISGRDPYDHPFLDSVPYPLPAAFVALPLIGLPRELAGALFFGISSGLLAFGLTRDGYTRLLIFLAHPYWAAMLTVQWTPLLMAAALFPLLLPVTLAKPQIGLPLALTSLSRRGISACVVVGLASLLVMPAWPLRWISELGGYKYFLPMLVLPGPLLVLAWLRQRDPDSHLLLLAAVTPQRWFYDAFILWLIPKTRAEILATACVSWCAGIWRWYNPPHEVTTSGRWSVLCFYLPMLLVILLRRDWRGQPVADEAPQTGFKNLL